MSKNLNGQLRLAALSKDWGGWQTKPGKGCRSQATEKVKSSHGALVCTRCGVGKARCCSTVGRDTRITGQYCQANLETSSGNIWVEMSLCTLTVSFTEAQRLFLNTLSFVFVSRFSKQQMNSWNFFTVQQWCQERNTQSHKLKAKKLAGIQSLWWVGCLKTQPFTGFRDVKPATLKNTQAGKQFVTNKENKNYRE